MVCFFRKVVLKSDTAVALRRSLSLILWITLVSFINVYYEYFCKITGCFGIKTLLHVTCQWKTNEKQRFLDINMHIIEQNIRVLCNMMSYECHLMKIKGLWLILSIFLLFVTPIFGWKNGCVFSTWLWSNIIICCALAVKHFWNRTRWVD